MSLCIQEWKVSQNQVETTQHNTTQHNIALALHGTAYMTIAQYFITEVHKNETQLYWQSVTVWQLLMHQMLLQLAQHITTHHNTSQHYTRKTTLLHKKDKMALHKTRWHCTRQLKTARQPDNWQHRIMWLFLSIHKLLIHQPLLRLA